MSEKSIAQLDAAAAVTADDLFVMVDDPAGTPVTKKVAASAVAQLAADTIAANGFATAAINWDAIAAWTPSTAYAKGALVGYQGIAYRRATAGSSGLTFNPANWVQVTSSTPPTHSHSTADVQIDTNGAYGGPYSLSLLDQPFAQLASGGQPYAASSHGHGNITSGGAVGSAANKPLITATSGVITAGAFGSAQNTFCEGSDPRLTTLVPVAAVPTSRMTGTYARLSNGLAPTTAVSIASGTIALCPIFVPAALTLTEYSFRTSGGATWPNAASVSITFAVYSPHPTDNLPSQLLYSDSANPIPASTGQNSWLTRSISPGLALTRGIYWLALQAPSAAVELAGNTGTSIPTHNSLILLNQLLGLGATQTSVAAGISTAASGTIPASLDTRNLDMAFTTASSTTLRLRTNTPIMWLTYS